MYRKYRLIFSLTYPLFEDKNSSSKFLTNLITFDFSLKFVLEMMHFSNSLAELATT